MSKTQQQTSSETETETETTTDVEIVVDDEGDEMRVPLGENDTRETGVSQGAAGLMTLMQGKLADGSLAEEAQHKQHVVERATEEDVFYGEILLPGWFVLDDDDASDEFGHRVESPGQSVRVRGLIERYSEKAWRIVARREENSMDGSFWFHYAWCFVPVSISSVARVEGVESNSHAIEECLNRDLARGDDR